MTSKYKFNPVANKFNPKKGDKYFTINELNTVLTRVWNGHAIDIERAAKNNVFQTFKAAHAVRKGREAIHKAAQKAYPAPVTVKL